MTQLNHILYVEDEPDIRDITKMALELLGGLQLTIAEDGAAALAALPQFDGELILIDHMLPDMTGAELSQYIYQSDQHKRPIIMLTGHRFSQRERQDLHGVIGVIQKPYDPESLLTQIQALLAADIPSTP